MVQIEESQKLYEGKSESSMNDREKKKKKENALNFKFCFEKRKFFGFIINWIWKISNFESVRKQGG